MRVKGTSFIDAHAARSAGKLALSGTVTAAVAQPVAHARVGLQIVSGRAGPQARSAIALSYAAYAAPDACAEGAARPMLDPAGGVVLAADDDGRFCVRLSLPIDRYVARLEASASAWLAA